MIPWPNSILFGREEVDCWGAGVEGVGHARAGLGLTRQGDVEVEEAGRKVRAGCAKPLVGIPPSDRCDVGARVMVSSRLELEACFWYQSCSLTTRLATLVL